MRHHLLETGLGQLFYLRAQIVDGGLHRGEFEIEVVEIRFPVRSGQHRPDGEPAVTRHDPDVDMRDLLLSLSEVLRRADMYEHHQVSREALSTRERMSQVLELLAGQQFVPFVSLFSASGNKARGMLRSEATEENFRVSAKNYKYVHIATHGLINPDKPELSGLVFWKDTAGTSSNLPQLYIADKENDGVLYTREIYNLDLNADLVTLSACETGAGKLVKGEGLLSFVRGFSFSGVPNMLISYWKVNDKTTAAFMLDFYEGVLSGESYSAALRKAKLAAISNPSTSFPSSWGNFVLIGN